MAPRRTSAGQRDPILKPGALRAARYVTGMTIQDAATRAGFAKSTLVKAENGKHDLRWDHLTSLADVLGMHPADLMREPYATEAAVRIPRKPGQVAPRADACRERAGASS